MTNVAKKLSRAVAVVTAADVVAALNGLGKAKEYAGRVCLDFALASKAPVTDAEAANIKAAPSGEYYLSAIRKIRAGKAEGNPKANNVVDYAQKSGMTKLLAKEAAKAAKANGGKPEAPAKPEAPKAKALGIAELFAAYKALPAAEQGALKALINSGI